MEQEDNNYKIVLNDEEQYSIWPADRENALGRKGAGKIGTCVYQEVWTDMRTAQLEKKWTKRQRNHSAPA